MDNIIERSSIGIYTKTDSFEDMFVILQKKSSRIVFSFNTALYFLNKTEVTPNRIDITVPSGYNVHRIKNNNTTVHYIDKNYLELGLIEIETPFGNKVKSYNIERCICDIVRCNNIGLDREQTNKILKNYFQSKQKNIVILMEYAKKLKCTKKIETIMEILI